MNTSPQENTPAALASRFINNTGRHIFLTGKAGTGKTTFLRHIISHTHKKAVIAAPTGIAAINAGGVTIHSLFQLPFGAFVPSKSYTAGLHGYLKLNTPHTLIKEMQLSASKRKLLQEMELLIIDEVSMLRSDLLDAIDTVLRSVRRQSAVPFGGVQVLFIGDLLQLPPVVKDDEWQVLKNHYSSVYFFDAHALRQSKPLYIELDKIYRQADDSFISILNNLRTNKITERDINILNTYYKPGFKAGPEDNYIYLTTHNSKADSINKEELRKLPERSYFFKATHTGEFSEYSYPVDPSLELKKGAQVMFIKNDPTGQQRFFNGKIGKIISVSESEIKVGFNDGSAAVTVEKYEWQNIRYNVNEKTGDIQENILGTFTQYPVKLAWAITVHKSQGLTFTKAIIDIGSAFAPGQVYVALSRLTSLDGLVLSSPINFKSLAQDNAVSAFAETKDVQEPLGDVLKKESLAFLNRYLLHCFDFSDMDHKLKKHIEAYTKDEKRSAMQKHKPWAVQLHADFEEAKAVADKFIQQLQNITSARNDNDQLQARVIKAKEYFAPILKKFSTKVINHIEKVKEEKKMKAYLTELVELDAGFYKLLQLVGKAEAMVKSFIENTELTKQPSAREEAKAPDVKAEVKNEDVKSETAPAKPVPYKTRQVKEKKEPKPKREKGLSQLESYNLYRQGKTPEEISKERGMAVSTIEGHLAQYITSGEIEVTELITKEKLDAIVGAAKRLDTMQLTMIKQDLGGDYSYSDIRYAMAWYQVVKNKESASAARTPARELA